MLLRALTATHDLMIRYEVTPSSTQGRRENHLCGARIHFRRRALLHRRRTSAAHAILCSPAAVPWGSGNLSRLRFLTFRTPCEVTPFAVLLPSQRSPARIYHLHHRGPLPCSSSAWAVPAICIAVSGGLSGYVLTSTSCWLGYLAIQRHIVLHSMGHRPNFPALLWSGRLLCL